jgi:glycosyltransferase involved in cell wall biosynthesis
MKKEILIISPYNPYNNIPSGSSYFLLSRLKKLVELFNVTLVTFKDADQNQDLIKEINCQNYFVKQKNEPLESYNKNIVKKIFNILRGNLKIFKIINGLSLQLSDSLKEIITKKRYDLIQVEDIVIAPIYKFLPPDTPKILIFHNVLSNIAQSIYVKNSFLKKAIAFWESLWIKRFEKKMVGRYKYAIAITQYENQYLKKINSFINSDWIPIDIDTNKIMPHSFKEDSLDIAFFGTMSYPPNEEAALFFIKKVMPILQIRNPSIKFFIIGKNPGKNLLKYSNDKIIITGEVDNIEKHLYNINIVVAPIFYGGGMRVKILQAMAMAKAVISTCKGAEGILYTNNKNIIIANNANDFADAITNLISNPIKAKKIGLAARKLIEETYSTNIVWNKWKIFYSKIV